MALITYLIRLWIIRKYSLKHQLVNFILLLLGSVLAVYFAKVASLILDQILVINYRNSFIFSIIIIISLSTIIKVYIPYYLPLKSSLNKVLMFRTCF